MPLQPHDTCSVAWQSSSTLPCCLHPPSVILSFSLKLMKVPSGFPAMYTPDLLHSAARPPQAIACSSSWSPWQEEKQLYWSPYMWCRTISTICGFAPYIYQKYVHAVFSQPSTTWVQLSSGRSPRSGVNTRWMVHPKAGPAQR